MTRDKQTPSKRPQEDAATEDVSSERPVPAQHTPDTMPMGVDVSTDISGNPAATVNANTGGPSSTTNIGNNEPALEGEKEEENDGPSSGNSS